MDWRAGLIHPLSFCINKCLDLPVQEITFICNEFMFQLLILLSFPALDFFIYFGIWVSRPIFNETHFLSFSLCPFVLTPLRLTEPAGPPSGSGG